MNRFLKRDIGLIAVLAGGLLLAEGASAAQYDFEPPYAADPSGLPLNGQEFWYNPSPEMSVSFNVYTYAGNTLGLPANPTGGKQFAGGTGPGGGMFARSQHDKVNGPGACWEYAYDFAAKFVGTPPALNNIGSFSKQPLPNDYIHLLTWVPGLEGVSYNAWYLAHDAAGVQFLQPGLSPGPAWDGLEVSHWYRATTIVDLASNRITEVRIKDLVTGTETIVNPADWYLEGGVTGSTAPATSFRLFAGSPEVGNVAAFDNVELNSCDATPVAATTWGRIKDTFAPTTRREGTRQEDYPIHWPPVD
jgi:hypothetical protein